MAYLDLAGFRTKVEFLRPEDVDLFESTNPGVIDDVLADVSDELDARLCKRYSTPFGTPYPRVIQRWVAVIAQERVMNRRGYNAADPLMARMLERVKEAEDRIKEAANSEDALFGLPSGGGTNGDGSVIRGGPLMYSEASPFVGADRQAIDGRTEDLTGTGTYGGR